MKALIKGLLFGNFFLGICAVALCLETFCLLQIHASPSFLVFCFLATVFYYNLAYITEQLPTIMNERANWYFTHHRVLVFFQWIVGISLLFCFFLFLKNYGAPLCKQKSVVLLSLSAFPLVATLYYGIHPRAFGFFKLRAIGWFKPFLIGFSWAGMVTILPLFFSCLERAIPFTYQKENLLLFGINFFLCSIIAILFDIKDYETDYNLQLKTFVVKKGLEQTIHWVLLPLCLTGMLCVFLFAVVDNYSFLQTLIALIPFALLLLISFSLKKEKNIFFYLFIIDGVALLKAIGGYIIYCIA